tara:strand:- start:4 stop:309 length:306 start_codon:yes stop_codon:yes gene_type:complete
MKNSYKDNFNFNMSPSEQEAEMQRQNKEYAMSQKLDDEPKKPITADANQLSDELYSVIDSLINDQSLDITNTLRRRLSDELEVAFDSIALTLDTLEGEQDE